MSENYALRDDTRSFLSRQHGLLIDGKFTEAASGKRTEIIDPATEMVIATVAEADASDVDRAVAAARKAFDKGSWRTMPPAQRSRILHKLADLIEENGDQIAEIESLNTGKPVIFCRNGDVTGVAEQIRYMAGWSTKLSGETHALSLPGEWHAYTQHEPVGVVGQIVPWNFPFNMAGWKIAPALAVGCTIVLKPAEFTPLSALRLGELALEAGVPEGVFNIVTGFGDPVGAALSSHNDVDKIAFTGSTVTGKRIVVAATGNLKRVSLELGGKSPVIVFPDADLDAAVMGASTSIFFHAGQVCSAGSRLYVHKKVYDKVLSGIADRAGKIKVGAGLVEGSEMGPLISGQQLSRVTSYIDQGRKDGVEVVAGGNRIGSKGYFVEPTILAGVKPGMSVHDEEIFGPVLSAMTFDDEDIEDLAAIANNTSYGLAASIWTRDISAAHRLASRLRAGVVNINTHTSPDATLPYGGYKQSGWGRERGKDVLELYTETKSVAVKLA